MLLKMKLVRLFSFFAASSLFIVSFLRAQPNAPYPAPYPAAYPAPYPASPSPLPAFASNGRYLCEMCPVGLVCHNALPNPPVEGFCVDSCRSCLTKFCQLCSSPSNNYPPCRPAGTGSCNKDRDCCGNYNGSTVCNIGLCGVPYGKFCWKDLDCVRGLVCYKNSCRDAYNPAALPLSTSTPSPTYCTLKLEEIRRLITYFQKENYNLIQLILAALRNVFPGASQQLPRSNDLNEFAQLNPIADVAPPGRPSSRATNPCKEECNEALQNANMQVEAMRNEHRLLLRVLDILIYGNRTRNEERPSNYEDYPEIADYVPGELNSYSTARHVTTVDQDSNVDYLMDFLSTLQIDQNDISPYVKNNEDIFSNSVTGFAVSMRVSPNQQYSEDAEGRSENLVPLLEAMGQGSVPNAKHSQDDQIKKDNQNKSLIDENLQTDIDANDDQYRQTDKDTQNLQNMPAENLPSNQDPS